MAFNLGNPPVGTGGYSNWVVFVIVIMLSVFLATWLGKAIGLK